MRDYADACFRYLRITGFVSIAHKSRTISIFDDKKRDVEFILANVNRNPVFVNDEDSYKAHLFDATTPELYTDNVENIIDVILRMSEFTRRDLANYDIEALKDLRDDIVAQHKENVIHEQVAEIKSYALYSEIIDTFNEIVSDEYYDAPLKLHDFEGHPYKVTDNEDMDKLVESIKLQGIISPLIVRLKDNTTDEYEVILKPYLSRVK